MPHAKNLPQKALPPYADEAFTLEVRIPTGMDREQVRDACLRHALAIEDQFGFFILTRVKVAEPTEASAPRP